ncbi:hypothetical protein Plhal304r1_c013g0048921 [Plasmopara halstedii]
MRTAIPFFHSTVSVDWCRQSEDVHLGEIEQLKHFMKHDNQTYVGAQPLSIELSKKSPHKCVAPATPCEVVALKGSLPVWLASTFSAIPLPLLEFGGCCIEFKFLHPYLEDQL